MVLGAVCGDDAGPLAIRRRQLAHGIWSEVVVRPGVRPPVGPCQWAWSEWGGEGVVVAASGCHGWLRPTWSRAMRHLPVSKTGRWRLDGRVAGALYLQI